MIHGPTCRKRQNLRMSDRVSPLKPMIHGPTCPKRQNLRMSDRVSPLKPMIRGPTCRKRQNLRMSDPVSPLKPMIHGPTCRKRQNLRMSDPVSPLKPMIHGPICRIRWCRMVFYGVIHDQTSSDFVVSNMLFATSRTVYHRLNACTSIFSPIRLIDRLIHYSGFSASKAM